MLTKKELQLDSKANIQIFIFTKHRRTQITFVTLSLCPIRQKNDILLAHHVHHVLNQCICQ